MITTATTDAIRRDRAALVAALAGAGSTVKGSAFTCVHPDHDDSNASGSIHANADGVWRGKCHACGWTGDVFDVQALATGRALGDVLRTASGGNGHHPAPATPRPGGNGKATKPGRTYPTPEAAAAAALASVREKRGDGWALTGSWSYRDAGGVEYAQALRFDGPGAKTFGSSGNSGAR